jgi:transcription termination/antitermination protein NusA
VDIRSETEFAEDEADMGYQEEEVAGRCAAILANGKRCPNAALPGSRYCPVPAHQALEGQETDHVVPPDGDGAEPAAEGVIVEEAAVEESAVEESAVEDSAVEDSPVEEAAADEAVADAPVDDPVGGAPDEPAKPDAAEPAVPEGVVGGVAATDGEDSES